MSCLLKLQISLFIYIKFLCDIGLVKVPLVYILVFHVTVKFEISFSSA